MAPNGAGGIHETIATEIMMAWRLSSIFSTDRFQLSLSCSDGNRRPGFCLVVLGRNPQDPRFMTMSTTVRFEVSHSQSYAGLENAISQHLSPASRAQIVFGLKLYYDLNPEGMGGEHECWLVFEERQGTGGIRDGRRFSIIADLTDLDAEDLPHPPEDADFDNFPWIEFYHRFLFEGVPDHLHPDSNEFFGVNVVEHILKPALNVYQRFGFL